MQTDLNLVCKVHEQGVVTDHVTVEVVTLVTLVTLVILVILVSLVSLVNWYQTGQLVNWYQ